MLLHFRFDLLANVRLRLGDLQLLVDEHVHAFQAGQQVDRFQHFLLLLLAGGGQAGGEIGKVRRVVGVEVVEEQFEFFAVQGVQWHQFLDGIDHRDRVGLDLRHLFIARFGEILHPRGERVVQAKPLGDAKALQALEQHLHAAVHPGDTMNAAGRAHAEKIFHAGLFGAVASDQHQPDNVVGVFLGRPDGFLPGARLHQQGDGLAREERSFRLGQDRNGSRQDISGTHQFTLGGGGVFRVWLIDIHTCALLVVVGLYRRGDTRAISMHIRNC